jgi:uncharacterized NAD(P)/FAD-binding protein YdhS
MRFSFAIIGGGLTGVSMIFQLVKRIRQKARSGQLDPSKINIQMFEKQAVFGPGFPHSENNALPCHLINMCAQDMGINSANPGDFQNWADSHRESIYNHYRAFFNESDLRQDCCDYYPRPVMGEYLKSRFGEAIEKAGQLGLGLELYSRCEVTNLLEENSRVRLTFKNFNTGKRFSIHSDRALIATGHWLDHEERDHFFPSPWPPKTLVEGIPTGESVAIIGTSLSALDATLALTAEGEFHRDAKGVLTYVPASNPRNICLYSRRGLLPRIRGKTGDYKNRFLTLENVEKLTIGNNGMLSLETIFHLLESDLEAAYGHRIEWTKILNPTASPIQLLKADIKDAKQGDGHNGALLRQTVLHRTLPFVRKLYTSLSAADRKRFDKKYATLFFSHASAIPLINGEKLLALMKSGTVDVVKLGDPYRFIKDASRGDYEFVYRTEQGMKKRRRHKYVIDARGQKKSYETNPSELAQNLLRSGTIQIEELPYLNHPESHDHMTEDPDGGIRIYRTGGMWIDPDTHHVVRKGIDGKKSISERIYAVGAMTRGQIIDASMAHASAVSTDKIAESLTGFLEKTQSR